MQTHLEILQRAVALAESADSPMSHKFDAVELSETIDVSLNQSGASEEQIEQSVLDFIKYSPNVAHPEYFKLLYSGLNKDALLGDWVASLSNVTMHTYQVGPVATLMELELIKQWCQLVGFDAGEGVMVSGGSQANLVGMLLARHKACPEFKTHGFAAMNGKQLTAYVSDQSHYSNQRAVNTLGIGADNLTAIASDENGRLVPERLEKAIQDDIANGKQPFFIGLTAGTTVVGAFDPVKPCAEIARKYDLWLHIDGAWGAPVLFSEHHKHLLDNSQLADSFAWDAHKLMNVPVTAAVILVKQSGQLRETIAGGGGDYLFHADINEQYNLGERSLQCGRRADALKVWLSWKAAGSQGFAEKVDALFELKNHCVELIDREDKLNMIASAGYLNVLFRYESKSLDEEQTAALNISITKKMCADGNGYVDYATYKGRTGIRLILANQTTGKNDILKFIDEIIAAGDALQ